MGNGFTIKCKIVAHWLNSGKFKSSFYVLSLDIKDENENERIVKEMEMIRYPSLIVLDFTQNRIKSIEGISRISMPILAALKLSNFKTTKEEMICLV